MSRYIDADKLLTSLPNDLPYKASVKRVLILAPTADVVEVVRCKDCKLCRHCYPIKKKDEKSIEGYYCEDNRRWVSPSGYCSRGERSENGKS